MVSKKRNSFPMMKPFWNYIINKRHDKKEQNGSLGRTTKNRK